MSHIHRRLVSLPATGIAAAFLLFAVTAHSDLIKRSNPPTPEPGGTNYLGWIESSHHGGALTQLVATAWVNLSEDAVTHVRWWGGYEGWTGVTPPPAAPTVFRLHMWSHDDNSPFLPFPRPATVLWTATVTTVSIAYEASILDPRTSTNTTNTIFRYDANLPAPASFVPDPAIPRTYWFSIGAVDTNESPAHPWGWLLRQHPMQQAGPDKAVLLDDPTAPVPGDSFVSGSVRGEGPWDSAFVLSLATPATDDFGDAPDTYGTTLAANGARHAITSPLALGGGPDAESDGFPSADAKGDDNDASADEDGVVFSGPLVPGTVQFAVVSASVAGGQLNAWIDFDRDGNWMSPNDRIATDLPLAAGPNVISINVPANASSGRTYARFRLSTQSGLGTSGIAPDGEVEDHAVAIGGFDFGDAPEGFPTLSSFNGARHVTPASLWLGGAPDEETDGHPSAGADGDDLTDTDDEDGITFPSPLTPGATNIFFATASTSGLVNAWIDFDGSLSWNNVSERIATNVAVTAGVNVIRFAAPSVTTSGVVIARIRISTAPLSAPTGEAADGEVEDHAVVIAGLDFGDAPAGFPVTLASEGARHVIPSPIWLGGAPDVELDGPASAGADGDDLAGVDDEDGVSLPGGLAVGQSNLVRIVASTSAVLNAWMDLDHNDAWGVGEQVFSNLLVTAGTNDVWADLPDLTAIGPVVARFRLSSAADLALTGQAPDGEVEDYLFTAQRYDYGDAPAGFPVTLAQDGARHLFSTNLWLGAVAPDGETNGIPSANADGDDTNGTDDEDGVVFPATIPVGSVVTVAVTCSSSGILNAWIDFNQDHSWSGPGEQIVSNLSVLGGAQAIVLAIPPEVTPGSLAARFRFSTAGDPAPTGAAVDGEVEDYILSTSLLDFGDAPSGYPVTVAQDGARHLVTSGLCLGAVTPDGENNGLPSDLADGDDLDGTDDEEGVVLPASIPVGGVFTVTVTASSSGILNAWIDFNLDFTWATLGGEQIAANLPVAAGAQQIVVTVPAQAPTGPAGARFRISTAGDLAPTGLASDGEVEDYLLILTGMDFGDAPTNYPVTAAQDGARHALPAKVWLGPNFGPDAEVDGQPSAGADGDDLSGSDDEDGVSWPMMVFRDETTNLMVTTSVTGAFLNAWIDFDQDGTWSSPAEQIATDVSLPAGATAVSLAIPGSALPGPTYARFRVSTAAGIGPQGLAADGEVEDYPVLIGQHVSTNEIAFTQISVTETSPFVFIEVQAPDPVFYQLQTATNLVEPIEWKQTGGLLPGPLGTAVDTNPVESQKAYRLAVPFTP